MPREHGADAASELWRTVDTLRKKGNAELAEQIETAVERSRAIIAQVRRGFVLVGRLTLVAKGQDPRACVSQAAVLENGWFVTEVADLHRRVSFRLSGFEPLELLPARFAKRMSADLLYVGDVPLRATRRPAKIRGHVRLVGSDDASSILVTLRAVPGPANTPYAGTATVASPLSSQRLAVDPSGHYETAGLSAMSYQLDVTAKGYSTVRRTIKPSAGRQLEVDAIDLEPAKRLSLTYAIGTRTASKKVRTRSASTSAGDVWTPKGAPNPTFAIAFRQRDGRILATSPSGALRLADLGNGSVASFVTGDLSRARFRMSTEHELMVGNLYLVEHPATHSWLLFQCSWP